MSWGLPKGEELGHCKDLWGLNLTFDYMKELGHARH